MVYRDKPENHAQKTPGFKRGPVRTCDAATRSDLAADGVRETRVPAVDEYVSLFQQGNDRFDKIVHRLEYYSVVSRFYPLRVSRFDNISQTRPRSLPRLF